IVNLRLKGAGMFWLQANAEHVLLLRCYAKLGGGSISSPWPSVPPFSPQPETEKTGTLPAGPGVPCGIDRGKTDAWRWAMDTSPPATATPRSTSGASTADRRSDRTASGPP